jgi:hypothetical protein
MAEAKKGQGEAQHGKSEHHESAGHGSAAEQTRAAAERALSGEHDPFPASDLQDGGHAKSHAAHTDAPPQHMPKQNAQDKPEGNLRQGSYPGGRRQP